VGRLSHTARGLKVLERGEILRRLLDILLDIQHPHYVKLILSSLSYREEACRRILASALTCSFQSSRLYATQFFRLLLRAKLPDLSKWGVELLVKQLGDESPSVKLAALDILEEAVHDKVINKQLLSRKG
jgi:hypothetical protein